MGFTVAVIICFGGCFFVGNVDGFTGCSNKKPFVDVFSRLFIFISSTFLKTGDVLLADVFYAVCLRVRAPFSKTVLAEYPIDLANAFRRPSTGMLYIRFRRSS